MSKNAFKWPDSKEVALKTNISEIILALKGVDIWRTLPLLSPEFVN